MSQVVALVHKVKGTFRRNDPFVKYMDRIVSTADSHAEQCQPAAVELDDDVDVDFFDRQDLGVLNRRLRKVWLRKCCAYLCYPEIAELDDIVCVLYLISRSLACSANAPDKCSC